MEPNKPAERHFTKIQSLHVDFNATMVIILGILLFTVMSIYIYENYFDVKQPNVAVLPKTEEQKDDSPVDTELLEKGIRIDTIVANAPIESPVKIEGEALVTKFQGSGVSTIIMDENGNTLASPILYTEPTEREGVVRVYGEAEFQKPETTNGMIIIEEAVTKDGVEGYSTHMIKVKFE